MNKTRREEYSEATQRALLKAARTLLAKTSYADVSIDQICERARVTKGALYHHFKNKKDLFSAVFDQVENEMIAEVATASAQQSDPWKQAEAAFSAYLTKCLDKAYQKIVFLEAPSILGRDDVFRAGQNLGRETTRAMLETLQNNGLIEPKLDLEMPTRLLLGMLMEAGLAIAESETPEKAREEAWKTILRFIESLRSQ